MVFQPSLNENMTNPNASSLENQKATSQCKQRLDVGSWSGEFCQTVTKVDPSTKKSFVQCECTKLSPTSVVADFNSVLEKSNLKKIFSA